MDRAVPGVGSVEGREFLYLESGGEEDFYALFPKITTFGDGPLPSSGGAINENAVIVTPDGRQMHGLSYKGDIAGWRRKITECAEENRLLWGEISEGVLRLSNDDVYDLEDCEVILGK